MVAGMTITATREVVIEATREEVLAVMLDLESLPEWSSTHLTAEVLERDDARRPLCSKWKVRAAGVVDDFVIELTYYEDGYGWTLVSSKYQRSQDARYTLTPEGDSTRERFDVTVDPVVPLPGFMLRQAAKGVVSTATDGLRKRVLSVKRSDT